MKLRGYQQACHDAIFEAWKTHTSTLVEAATGTGKTVIFAHVVKTMQPKRAMILAHRDELIMQAKEKIETVCGLDVEIEKAELYANITLFGRMPVVVSSVQTQISGKIGDRRYLRFNPMDFGLLIIDECHHAASKSYKEIIAHYRKNPDLKVLGVTATPDRSDKLALGQIFESVAFQYGILDAIQDGYLVEITQQYVCVAGLDYSHIRTTAGDLNEGDLSKVMEVEENVQGIAQPTIEVMYGLPPKTLSAMPVPEWRSYLAGLGKTPRRTIVFTVSVAQAEMCANVLSRAMPGVEWVCGATPQEKRRTTLDRFKTGETHAVVNCGVLLEGFDNPKVEVIAMARPTKSRSLYAQAVGRSTRPLPGLVDGLDPAEARRMAIAGSQKPFCRILDFVGNSGKHKLISCADVLGGKYPEEIIERAKQKAIAEGKPVRISVTLTNEARDAERKKREAAEKARQEAEARKNHLLSKVNYSTEDVDPFDGDTARPNGKIYRSKDGRPFSEKQSNILRRAGLDPSQFGYRQGQAIIGKIFSQPSPKQAKTLLRAGCPKDVISKMDFKAASEAITRAKANGWKWTPPPT